MKGRPAGGRARTSGLHQHSRAAPAVATGTAVRSRVRAHPHTPEQQVLSMSRSSRKAKRACREVAPRSSPRRRHAPRRTRTSPDRMHEAQPAPGGLQSSGLRAVCAARLSLHSVHVESPRPCFVPPRAPRAGTRARQAVATHAGAITIHDPVQTRTARPATPALALCPRQADDRAGPRGDASQQVYIPARPCTAQVAPSIPAAHPRPARRTRTPSRKLRAVLQQRAPRPPLAHAAGSPAGHTPSPHAAAINRHVPLGTPVRAPETATSI